MAKNRVIGAGNKIPWKLSADLKRFKEITMGHHLIMGRKTWESIGRPLPGRTTVVVTRQKNYAAAGATVADSLDTAIATCGDDDEIFVIGGAQLYAAALPCADRIYLTLVDAEIAGDTRMPEFDLTQWQLQRSDTHAADEKNEYGSLFAIYDRAH
ncbi:MAG TPA: dihydrofolate reductase [Burkholderiales bacterium]|nr:dihydrofolate reductase [Burkholderiales bacterium]